jgi:hypothetical protein
MVRRFFTTLILAICIFSSASIFAADREREPRGPVDRVIRLIRSVIRLIPNPLDELGQPKP